MQKDNQVSSMPMAKAQQAIARSTQSPITLGLSLPHLFPTPRFSDAFTGAPTAIANPFAVLNADWTSPSSEEPTNVVPKGSYVAAVSRSVLSHCLQWINLSYAKESIYDWYSATPSGPEAFANSFLVTCASSIIGDNTQVTPLNPHYSISRHWGDSAYNSIHGYTYYHVDANGRKGTWAISRAGSFFTFHIGTVCSTVGTTNRGLFFRVYLWTGSTWEPVGFTTEINPGSPGVSVSYYPPTSGYYAFEAVTNITYTAINDTNYLTVTVSQTLFGSGFGFSPMPHVEEMALNVDGIRATAVSVMLSPHPSVLNLGGEVSGVQLPPSESWYSVCLSHDPIAQISNLQGSFTGGLKHGIYGFLKPTSTSDYAMTEPFIITDQEVSAYYNPIQPPGGWLVIAASVAASDTGVYAGGLAYLTLASGVEYRTLNVWLNTAAPSDDPVVFERAVAALRGVQQWHENPFHIKDIMKSVLSAGKTALKVAPTIASLISSFFPGVAPSKALVGSLAALGRAL